MSGQVPVQKMLLFSEKHVCKFCLRRIRHKLIPTFIHSLVTEKYQQSYQSQLNWNLFQAIPTPNETHSVMRGVMGVDEDGLGLTVVVVLVVVLLGLPGRVVLGGVLTSGGDVVSLEDPSHIKYKAQFWMIGPHWQNCHITCMFL